MKRKKLFVAIVILLIAVGIVGVIHFFPVEKETTEDNIFTCQTVEELETLLSRDNIPYEKYDGTIHMYTVKYGMCEGYSIAEFDSNDGKISRVEFYTTCKNNAKLTENIDSIKNMFLKDFGFEGEYEYFPINGETENVSEKDFINQKASKELFVYEDDITWNISCYVVAEDVSVRISKTMVG